jgi:hypothetical protein
MRDSVESLQTSAKPDLSDARVQMRWQSPHGERRAFSFTSEGRRWVAVDAETASEFGESLGAQGLGCSDPNELTELHVEILIGPSVEELRLLYNDFLYVFGPLVALAAENGEGLGDDE